MSAAALFTPGSGDFHVPVSIRLADIPRGQQLAAWRVYSAVVDFLRRGQTQPDERFTDRILQQSPWLNGYSRRFVQKGLKTLTGLGIIRRIPHHGRRLIVVTGRLRGRDQPKPAAKADARPSKAKPSSIPNVGIIPPTTPEQLAAAQARIAAQLAEPPEPTPEEKDALDRFMEESRQRRQAAQRARLRPTLVNAPRPADPNAPGRTAQAALEARRHAMGVRIAPEPEPDPDPGPGSPPQSAGP